MAIPFCCGLFLGKWHPERRLNLELDTQFITGQIVGLYAFSLCVYSFSQTNDKRLRVILGLSSLTMALHFYLIGAFFGVFGALLSGVRMITSIYKWGIYFMPIFIGFYLYLAWINDTGWVEYLPVIGGLIGTITTYFFSGVRMRLGFMTGQFTWLVYNILNYSIGGIMLEITNIITNKRTILKMRKENNAR